MESIPQWLHWIVASKSTRLSWGQQASYLELFITSLLSLSGRPRVEYTQPGSLQGYNVSWYEQMFRSDKEVSVYEGLILSFSRDLRAFC